MFGALPQRTPNPGASRTAPHPRAAHRRTRHRTRPRPATAADPHARPRPHPAGPELSAIRRGRAHRAAHRTLGASPAHRTVRPRAGPHRAGRPAAGTPAGHRDRTGRCRQNPPGSAIQRVAARRVAGAAGRRGIPRRADRRGGRGHRADLRRRRPAAGDPPRHRRPAVSAGSGQLRTPQRSRRRTGRRPAGLMPRCADPGHQPPTAQCRGRNCHRAAALAGARR